MMINISTLAMYLAASWALILIPGPDILYVLARGLSAGRRTGVISALGIGFGECIQTMLAVAGLAAILATSLTAFVVIKYLGAAYLVYLGIKTVRDKNAIVLPGTVGSTPKGAVFWQGMLTNLFNPKAELFFVAFLPQFVIPAHGHPHFQIFILGLIFALSDIIFLCTLAYYTGRLHAWLSRHPEAFTQLRWGTGGILIGLGLRLVVAERP